MPGAPVFSMADAEAVAPLRALADQVRQAADAGTRLRLAGGDTKRFVAVDREVADPRDAVAEPLSLRALSGIVSYQPTELVVTVRAGTPLAEVEAALAERGQCLPAEPPRFGNNSLLLSLGILGLALFGGGVLWILTVASGADSGLKMFGYGASAIGAICFVVSAYLLLRRLAGPDVSDE